MPITYFANTLQPKIYSDVSACYPWVACPFRYSPLLDLRTIPRVIHDVYIPVTCHSVTHRRQGEICGVWLLERLDLGRVIQEAGRAIPCAQNQRAAVRNGKKNQIGQGCILRTLWQTSANVQRLVVLGDDCKWGSRLNSQARC